MMDSDKPLLGVIVVLVTVILLFILAIFYQRGIIYSFKEDAIKTGHAEYNATTGVWQWRQNCRDEYKLEGRAVK